MPRIDLSGVAEVSGTGNYNLEPGGYVMVVTDFSAPAGKEYVQLMLDVAEGPHKGFYAKSQRPLSLFLNWSENMRGRCKHMLHQFADSNNWDSNAAFQNDDWKQFVGKSIGCIVRMEMHTYQGKDYENSEVADVTTPAAIRSGDFVVPPARDRRERQQSAGAVPNPPASAAPTTEKMPWD